MVRLSEQITGGTGAGADSTETTSRSSRQQGRRLAVRMILDADSGPSAASDGGLSPAARRWMDATPGADVADARAYDRAYQIHQELSRTGSLPPRGDPGDSTNYERSAAVNAARGALREYTELVEQDDNTDE